MTIEFVSSQPEVFGPVIQSWSCDVSISGSDEDVGVQLITLPDDTKRNRIDQGGTGAEAWAPRVVLSTREVLLPPFPVMARRQGSWWWWVLGSVTGP